MQSLKALILLLYLTSMWSCDNSTKKNVSTTKSDSIKTDTSEISSENQEYINYTNNEAEDDTIVDIRFEELSISINSMIVYDNVNRLAKTQKDTVYVYPELGETLEGQTISISNTLLNNLKIEQSYQTSVTIMGEGPHCDLVDWKHYHSEWTILKPNSSGKFECQSYSEKEWEKFPKIQISKLKAAVKKHCEEGYYKLISNIKSPTEYPSEVGVSQYFLRITGIRKDTRQTITKLIIFEMPMGC